MREAKREKRSSWSISFQDWFGTTFVVKLNTLWIGAPLQRLQILPWWKSAGSVSSGMNATNRAHTPKGVKKLAEIWQGLRRQDALPVDGGGRQERRPHRRSCAAGSPPLQRVQRCDDVFRRQATAVIDVDISKGHAAILCDDEPRRQRQFPALIAVDTGGPLSRQPHRRTPFLLSP